MNNLGILVALSVYVVLIVLILALSHTLWKLRRLILERDSFREAFARNLQELLDKQEARIKDLEQNAGLVHQHDITTCHTCHGTGQVHDQAGSPHACPACKATR